MSQFSLSCPWSLSWESQTIPAQVPGNVVGDLRRVGLIADPYVGCNSHELRKYEFVDWTYRTSFPKPKVEAGESLQIVFEGIDTFAEAFVNGTSVGKTDNMFVEHRLEVPLDILLDENELTVKIESSVNHARKLPPLPPYCTALPYNYDALHVRRPVHSYGFDIAPRIVGAGIWRKAYLETYGQERWTDLYLTTVGFEDNGAWLGLAWNFVSDAPSLEGLEGRITLSCRGQICTETFPLHFTSGKRYVRVERPYCWNPRGSGEQNLYDATLELLHGGECVDVRKWRTGIRTIELKRTEILDSEGKGEFVFIVNGRRTFIKGSNWVPADAIHGENPERVEKSLELFVEAGCNMIRCWGGNVYEDQEFFDFCDEQGLLVWQDFMFACEAVPQDDAFMETVRKEAEGIVIALRNHASLALWCGDNEGDEIVFNTPTNRRLLPSCNRITREILPRAVQLFDPMRDYLPSSPFLHDDLKRRNTRYRSPEQHLWGPRDTWKNDFYKNSPAIFASEIGYHGMPAAESVRRFIPESDLNQRRSASWLCHCSQPFDEKNGIFSYRLGIVEDQTRAFFGDVPDDLDTFCRLSQIVQAEADKSLIEMFRMGKWNRTGIIWWNMIDCWPQFSDAVVDYYYGRKLAFHYIRNSQKPLLLAISDPDAWQCAVIADNESAEPAAGKFRVTDLISGEMFLEGDFRVEADAASCVGAFKVFQQEQRMLLIEWECNGKVDYNHYLLGNPPFSEKQYMQWLARLDELIYHRQ